MTSEEWRSGAERWIGDRLAERAIAPTGPIEQRRVRPWSTQLTVPTTAGTVWFKANCAAMAHEPAVHAALAGIDDDIAAPLAIEADEGWLLTLDAGSTLAGDESPSSDDWRTVMHLAARLQRAVIVHRHVLIAAGLPDHSPSTAGRRFDELVDAFSSLPDEHPSRLDADRRRQLVAARTRLIEAADELGASPLPATFQHGDLHPGNVFAGDTGLRLFDFGDAQWAHALEVLVVPMGIVGRSDDVDWDVVWEAYTDGWNGVASPSEMEPLLAAAELTHAVNRSATWWAAVAEATAAELADWGDAPLGHLLRVLDAA